MTAQIEAFSRNRFDQSFAPAEFCKDNTLNFLSICATRVLSIRNCAKCFKFSDNKANTARWGTILISSIPFKCPLCSYNETVDLKKKLNNEEFAE